MVLLATAAAAAVAVGVLAARLLQPGQATAEVTLAMIKPDAVAAGKAGAIKAAARSAGFVILAEREYTLTKEQVCL